MTPRREELLDLIVRWEEAKARGEPLAPEELCRDCPELRDELHDQLRKLEQVDWLNEPIIEALSATPGGAGSPAPSDDPLPRMMAARYRLDAPIGEGGFGRVYRGFDTWLERPVAIKVPRVDRAVSGPEIDLCRLEARKVARLRHPNIVPVHDVGRDGDTCFIVSEWIDGTNLEARIAAGRLPLRETLGIMIEVAEALGHAHERGFVHRDIKPANILLDRQGRAYLTDFGIAVVEEELLGDVNAAGTLPYMAPEQLDERLGPIDHRADLYALGVVFYELLTGRRPFEATAPVDLRRLILNHDLRPPHSVEISVPEDVSQVCARCLASRLVDRYPNADLLTADLRKILNF
jgi:eukaryotic-like serine/threonine-protein kinase